LEAFLRERLFEPLGMKDTAFCVAAENLDRLATSYEVNPESGALELYDAPADSLWSRPPAFPSAAGGLVSTADDYLAFFESGRGHVEAVLASCKRYFGEGFQPRRLLDFGCGVGRVLLPFAELCEAVVGVDISESMLAEARRNSPQFDQPIHEYDHDRSARQFARCAAAASEGRV